MRRKLARNIALQKPPTSPPQHLKSCVLTTKTPQIFYLGTSARQRCITTKIPIPRNISRTNKDGAFDLATFFLQNSKSCKGVEGSTLHSGQRPYYNETLSMERITGRGEEGGPSETYVCSFGLFFTLEG